MRRAKVLIKPNNQIPHIAELGYVYQVFQVTRHVFIHVYHLNGFLVLQYVYVYRFHIFVYAHFRGSRAILTSYDAYRLNFDLAVEGNEYYQIWPIGTLRDSF